VAKNSHVWGRFNAEEGTVDVQGMPDATAIDLLDDAVLHTLTNSGTVHIVSPDQVPEHADVAAILRY
jgi:hypothetical protein